MVEASFGKVEFSVPKDAVGNKYLEDAIIYADIVSILYAIPDVLKQHPDLRKSLKNDIEVLQALADLGHIVAG